MVRESRELHRPWTYPPERADQFDDLVSRAVREDFACLVTTLVDDGDLVGIFTISQIVRGYFQSAYLGYYASARHAGKGLMGESMELVLDHAFGPLSLHRLEANIQPGNAPSIALARGAGFRLEGFSPRYLLIGGRWRDHERYAITADEHAQNRAGLSGSEQPELGRLRARGARARRPRRTTSGSGTTELRLLAARAGRAPAARAAPGCARSRRAAPRASTACRARRPGGRAGTAAPCAARSGGSPRARAAA